MDQAVEEMVFKSTVVFLYVRVSWMTLTKKCHVHATHVWNSTFRTNMQFEIWQRQSVVNEHLKITKCENSVCSKLRKTTTKSYCRQPPSNSATQLHTLMWQLASFWDPQEPARINVNDAPPKRASANAQNASLKLQPQRRGAHFNRTASMTPVLLVVIFSNNSLSFSA